ncbi:hypothetical protein FOWG_17895 [Fusarium oxysporum f. sp. lycopersici MN25]|nr:hypothetical protein FOWG_17895 [Fusarium oxysporum f. sp. lycopersici MN25]
MLWLFRALFPPAIVPRPMRPSRHPGEDEMTRQSHYDHERECFVQCAAVVSKIRSCCWMMF